MPVRNVSRVRTTPSTKPATTTRTTATGRAARTPKGKIALSAKAGDPGIKLAIDVAHDRITFTGKTRGPKQVEVFGGLGGYQEGRAIWIEADMKQMPDFSKEPDYRAKNAWYFAHLFQVDTSAGWSAKEVAERLATKINAGSVYSATVTMKGEEATLAFKKR